MTGYATPATLEKIAVAPVNLRQRLNELIEAEIEHARAGRPAQIWAKMNSLVDPAIDRPALSRLAGRGARSSSSCAASAACGRACRACPTTSASRASSAASSSMAASSASATAQRCRRPKRQGVHLLGRLDAAQFRLARRGAGADRERDRASPGARRDHGAPSSRDEAQSWWLDADGVYRAGQRRSRRVQRPYLFHDQSQPVRARQRLAPHPPRRRASSPRGPSAEHGAPRANRSPRRSRARQRRRHRYRLEFAAARRL